MRKFVCLVLVAGLLAPVAEAQFLKKLKRKLEDLGPAPEVTVTIEHPPGLGLEVERVAFGPAEGECADEFVDSLISSFTSNGVEVVNRRQIESLLAEHEFSLSGVVSRDDAMELGEILGPSALVFVSVRRCATERTSSRTKLGTYSNGAPAYEYMSTTRAHFNASIQVVDLATGRIDRARSVSFSMPESNTSRDGYPNHPSEFDAIGRVMRLAVGSVNSWFFPWTETKTLKFYDDNECNLKLAYNLVQGQDFQGAREQSEENAKACEPRAEEEPKIVARAFYNLGMSEFLASNYDAALEAFNRSLHIEDLDYTPQAIADCRRAQEAAQEMRAFAGDDDSTIALASTSSDAEPAASKSDTSSPPAEEKSLADRLEELQTLHEQGLITDELYEKKQAELLKDI